METYFIDMLKDGEQVGTDFFGGAGGKVTFGTLVMIIEKRFQNNQMDAVKVYDFDKAGNKQPLIGFKKDEKGLAARCEFDEIQENRGILKHIEGQTAEELIGCWDKPDLMDFAKDLKIPGRSKMNKPQLAMAIEDAMFIISNTGLITDH